MKYTIISKRKSSKSFMWTEYYKNIGEKRKYLYIKGVLPDEMQNIKNQHLKKMSKNPDIKRLEDSVELNLDLPLSN